VKPVNGPPSADACDRSTRKPSRERQNDRVGDEVRSQHPGRFFGSSPTTCPRYAEEHVHTVVSSTSMKVANITADRDDPGVEPGGVEPLGVLSHGPGCLVRLFGVRVPGSPQGLEP